MKNISMSICFFVTFSLCLFYYSECSLPLVIWHGLGGSCCNDPKMKQYISLFKNYTNNSIYVKSMMIGYDEKEDVLNTFIMPLDMQVKIGCTMIQSDKNLWGGYIGVGCSQGSLTMRGIAQKCPWPPMKKLILLCGPNQGVFGIPDCEKKLGDFRCDVIRRSLSPIVYTDPMQDHEVQAEYWHDPYREELYREKSAYLADLNQERIFKPEYKANMIKLQKLVMVKFLRDTIVHPIDSEWFGFYKANTTKEVYSMRESPLYTKDLLGFRTLDNRKALAFEEYDGGHCDFSDEFFISLINKYIL